MPSRLTTASVVFRRAFAVPGWREPAPAGAYTVETEEALIEGVSFPAYRRVAITLTPRDVRPGALLQQIVLAPQVFEAAVERDLTDDIMAGA